jgi:hypothetical protein
MHSFPLPTYTVIVMGSDFGRTMNANSNGGTDHAWVSSMYIDRVRLLASHNLHTGFSST